MNKFSTLTRVASNTAHKLKAAIYAPRIRRQITQSPSNSSGTSSFAVFFADPQGQQYQLLQWITPLETLATSGAAVTLIVSDPFVAKSLSKRTTLPICLFSTSEDYAAFLARNHVRVVFYVNNSQANFTALRIANVTHIHLNHGESDKVSMVSNQLKAYDFAFIAGDAALQRITQALSRIQLENFIRIGRPQLDLPPTSDSWTNESQRIRVLYAPTWEGDSKEMAYSSISTIGLKLVQALLGDSRFDVTVRPHPKTGTWSNKAAQDLRSIGRLVRKAHRSDPAGNHSVDTTLDATQSLAKHDVILADNSAMTLDAVGLNKPVFLTVTDELLKQAELAPSLKRTVQSIPHIQVIDENSFCDVLVAASLAPIPPSQQLLRDHIFGPSSLGRGTDRFVTASMQILDSAKADDLS